MTVALGIAAPVASVMLPDTPPVVRDCAWLGPVPTVSRIPNMPKSSAPSRSWEFFEAVIWLVEYRSLASVGWADPQADRRMRRVAGFSRRAVLVTLLPIAAWRPTT